MSRILIVLLLLTFRSFFSDAQDMNKLKVFIQIENREYIEALNSVNMQLQKAEDIDLCSAKLDILIKLEKYSEALDFCTQKEKIYVDNFYDYKLIILNAIGENAKVEELLRKKANLKIELFDLLNNDEYVNIQGVVLDNVSYTAEEKQLYQCKVFIKNKKYTDALFLTDKILSNNQKCAAAYYLQSIIYSNLDDQKSAMSAINKALNLKKVNVDYIKQKIGLSITAKDYQSALLYTKSLIRIEDYIVDNYVLYIHVLVLNKKYGLAIEKSESLIKVLPTHYDLLLDIGKSYLHTDNYLQALKYASEAIELKSSKEAFGLRADIYMKTETFQFAEFDYSMCLDLDPYNGDIYAKKGLSRYMQGNKKGACADWKKAKRYGSYEGIRLLNKYCN